MKAHISKKMGLRVGVPVAAVAVVGLSFYSGVDYQKHHAVVAQASATAASARSGFGGQGGFGGMGGGFQRTGGSRVIGQVTAVSSTSITVQESDGTSKTLTITSSTVVNNDGQSASVSSIATGDTVFITADSSDSSQAARILLNPSFGGGSGSSDSEQNAPSNLQSN